MRACRGTPAHLYSRFAAQTTLFINTTYNDTLFAGPDGAGIFQVAQMVPFLYFDKEKPPTVDRLHPSYAPISGRPLRIVGDWDLVDHGHWEDYSGAEVHGGVVLIGSNFAPTNFLWCAFGIPQQAASTRGPWRFSRGVFINSSAARCEVTPGFHGDFLVAASTDDVKFSVNMSTITYYDPLVAAVVTPSWVPVRVCKVVIVCHWGSHFV